jgi:MFS family permease
VADVFGRLESFSLAIFVYTLGYIQQAASNNVRTYAAAQIFYSAGSQGLQILQQIFVADTTDLRNRALFSTLFDLPFLWTVWAGSPIAQSILKHSTWRWGYGIWAIVLPVAFIPLATVLLINQMRAKREGKLPPSAFAGQSPWQVFRKLWIELDTFGLLLLSAAICLILIPLTLAASAKDGWRNGSIIAMLVIGVVCLAVFPFWERSTKFAPHAFFPKALFQNRTVVAGVLIAFFYFSKSILQHS